MGFRGGPRPGPLPTLLHLAAQYGLRALCGLLLQVPGAPQALATANRHGLTPGALARSHGHAELSGLLNQYCFYYYFTRLTQRPAETDPSGDLSLASSEHSLASGMSAEWLRRRHWLRYYSCYLDANALLPRCYRANTEMPRGAADR
ncbi:unnamed protein product [Arctogadus glacialis]